MFAFDQALLPQLNTRKALILVDFQNDFVESDGALPATDPEGFVNRTARLISGIRGKGDVVWVQSQFDKPVPAYTEAIIVSDTTPATRYKDSRGPTMTPMNSDEPPDEEAFLSQAEASCAKIGSWGVKTIPAMQEVMHRRDTVITKSHYSGFNGTPLLRTLRAKMVMEVFICGSMANVGVYATALDAAGHGLSITIVEDCCGYRNEQRQLAAMRNLIELAGCEIASVEEVIENLQASSDAISAQTRGRGPSITWPSVTSSSTSAQPQSASDTVSGISTSLGGLQLNSIDAETVTDDDAAKNQASPAELEKIHLSNKQEINARDDKSLAVAATKQPTSRELNVCQDLKSAVLTSDGKIRGNDDDDIEAPRLSQHGHTKIQAPSRMMSWQPTASDSSATAGRVLQKGLGEGDTDIIENVLPHDVEENVFEELQKEAQWQRMLHQGGEVPRLVAVQGGVAQDGSMPVYRHPSDESPPLLPFSPTVLAIKAETEKHLGHALNHVLIQLYRDGKDYISEHSDKTIDVVKGSYIANVSIGAERTMVLRTKRRESDADASATNASWSSSANRQIQRARLPHNSLCRMGLRTNRKWLHSIRQDKRAERDKTPAETAYGGGRISLTFRRIGTFLDKHEKMIWGQGATGKTRDAARSVINGQGPEATAMLKAFGAENNSSVFDWDAHYGKGFDVLHISNSPRFFASADRVANVRIWLMLADLGVNYARGSIANAPPCDARVARQGSVADSPIRFVDNDEDKSVMEGEVAIMLYLDAVYGQTLATHADAPDFAMRFSRLQRALKLADLWRCQGQSRPLSDALLSELAIWDAYAAEAALMSNANRLSIVDYAAWPVLHALVETHGYQSIAEWENLTKYYKSVAGREATKKVLGSRE
ncbi:hypothetical protein E4U42_000388 [Claviceps africana]|uniref:Fe2OG dioxygenase domain-containing protein n=1 Tax=Claviceps africana TaxID=83212 RepID=A0A8K0NJQ3_9HYPO|nr:hypothetical protein E4U42_000388 [Claviceps africana]